MSTSPPAEGSPPPLRSESPEACFAHVAEHARELGFEFAVHGIRHGWAQSRRDAEGTYSLLVLARSAGEITAEELRQKEERLQWLVYAAHVSMQASCHEGPAVPPKVALSAREVEVLRWTAEGKTAAEIASILGLSERTVNFHINNAVVRLGASNKTSAAVRAAMLGLIW